MGTKTEARPQKREAWGVDLPFQHALNRALDLESRRRSNSQPRFNFDFRPHSHPWQVMAMVRASEHEAGTIRTRNSTPPGRPQRSWS